MTQRQAALTSVGEYQQKREAYERQQQLEWERSRWMAWSIIAPFLGKKGPKNPLQWVRFPWENKPHTQMFAISEFHNKTLDDIFKDFKSKKEHSA
jgi:hypothetical protein